MSKAIRGVARLYTCAWCGERKPLGEMRNPGSGKGKSPATCRACRETNAALSWCDAHGEPHPIDRFRPQGSARPGVRNVCRNAQAQAKSRELALPPISCVACNVAQETWQYRGGRQKSLVCRTCQSDHPGLRWCVDCSAWLPEDRFNRTGDAGRFWTVRCRPCRAAHAHGVTVAEILRRQGTDEPECAACGSQDWLKVDHDHGCCRAERSCGRCVRGYLCHECNTAEGLLRTPERAIALADYMRRRSGVA